MFSFKDYNIFLTYDNSDPFFLEICRILPNSTTQDCGSTDPPAVVISGGWAKQNSVGVVAASSRTGRIFCHTRQINGTEAVLVTAEEVQEVAGRISSPRARYPQVNFLGFILIFWGYNYNIAIIFTIIYYNSILIYYMLYIYMYYTGWWFQTFYIFHFIYGMSSFPLTNSYFSRLLLTSDGPQQMMDV